MKNKILLIIKYPVGPITIKEVKLNPGIVSEPKVGNKWVFFYNVKTKFPSVVGCDGVNKTNG